MKVTRHLCASLAILIALISSARAQLPTATAAFTLRDIDAQSLGVWENEQPVLVYNHGEIAFQAGRRTRSRASYFHPIYGLDGEVLTDAHPADHYHHHGLFWAWTHVRIAGREYNFWEGDDVRIRFQKWLAKETSEGLARLGMENGWFLGDVQVMKEELWVDVHAASTEGRNLDFTLTWTPVEPITLSGAEGKSYGGFSLRFAPRRNTTITVPTGRAAEDFLVTKLPWADLAAQFQGAPEPSGAAIFVHSSHPDFPPEWMTREYGLLAVGWPGVEPKTLAAGRPVTCRYRVWIHRGRVGAAAIQKAYDAYGNAGDPDVP
jgi:Methane oxygenase PmoA